MAKSRLVLVRSAPSCEAKSAFDAAAGLKRLGEEVDLCLLQDGVLCALADNEAAICALADGAVRSGIGLYFLEEDLIARGFGREDARPEARALSYQDLVELMLDGQRTTLGAF
ncbi:MAG: DsrH/TusB family sulfur metabolism protein [Chloroflexota bacterium]